MNETPLPPRPDAEERLRRGHAAARTATAAVAALAVALAAGVGWLAAAYRAEGERVAEAARQGSLDRARALIAAGGPSARTAALRALEAGVPASPADLGLVRTAAAQLAVEESYFWPAFREHRCEAVAASADGAKLVFAPEPGALEVWDIAAAAREHRIAPGGEEFHYPVLSADGRFLGARRAGGNAEIWSLESGELVFAAEARRDGSSRGTLAFAGGASAFYADQAARFVAQIDLGSHAEVARWTLPGAPGPLAALPGGQVAASDAGGVYLLGAGGGAAQRLMETPAPVTALAFRPDGKLIAAGLSNGQLACAHLPSGQRWLKQAHDALVNAVLFSPDGALLATTSWDGRTAWHHGAGRHTWFAQRSAIAMALGSGRATFFRGELGVGFWDVAPPAGYVPLDLAPGAAAEISGIAGDGSRGLLAATNREAVWFWDLATGDLVARAPWAMARGLATRGSDFLCAGSGGVGAFRLAADGDGGWRCDSLGALPGTADLSFAAVAASGGTVAAAGLSGVGVFKADGLAASFDLPSGDEARLALDAGARWLATSHWKRGGSGIAPLGSSGGSGGGDFIKIDHRGGSVALSPDGGLAIFGSNAGYETWQRREGGRWDRIGQIPQLQGGDFPGAAAFSAGGDRAAWIWQQRGIGILSVSGRGLTETERFFPAGDPALFALWLAPGGDRVAAGTGDGKVHVWNLTPPGEILRALPAHAASLRPNPLPKFAAALIAGFGALAVVGSVAAWLMRRERRLLGGFLAGQRELDAHRERLRLAERMESLGRLSAGVAHDFRNILSIIRVRAGLLRRAVAGDDASAGDADAIERAVEKAEGVVRSLLHVGRPAAGNALPGSGFDAAAELADLRGLFAAKARGVEAFALDAADGLPLAAGNPVEFHQLALNLGWNAIDACGRAGSARLSLAAAPPADGDPVLAATRPPALWLCAEDGGPGIGEVGREKLFEPFFSTKALGPERGTGLGLSTVFGICRARGYALQVGRSPALGGALFAIGIPAAADPEPADPADPP